MALCLKQRSHTATTAGIGLDRGMREKMDSGGIPRQNWCTMLLGERDTVPDRERWQVTPANHEKRSYFTVHTADIFDVSAATAKQKTGSKT